MTIEHGGHLLPELLPAETLRGLPDDRDALAALRAVILEHARGHPEADVFHIWAADVPASGEGREVSERALAITNVVAEAVGEVAPSAQVAFLAYHDTQEVPRGVRPRHNVCLLWAPRERCYAHAAGDAGCPRNVRHRDTFRGQVEHFRSAGAAPPRVFEYYLDAMLFGRRLPPLGRVIGGDLAFYRDAGAHTVQALMTGFGPWREPHPNPWLFARLAWNPELDPVQLLYEFSDVVFGSPQAAERYRAEAFRRCE